MTQDAQYDTVILGIDPGTNIMGYGILGCKKKSFELITTGVIHLGKLENQAQKLKKIFERCLYLIDTYHPDELAIEAPFFGKNVQSMLKLGRAQGTAMAAALYRDMPIFEYAPKKVKQSITGSGNASKEQVAAMLQSLCQFEEMPAYLDATDGLAVAVCHFFQGGATATGLKKNKKSSGWTAFVKNNPDRLA
ncbi:MAG: crossover junction endodeoxyribonuclease RuvC [Bacteroidetes bacterium]|nr:crossover junction endodeoxyribonuclease RuvC [Bacteroidota bacterium]